MPVFKVTGQTTVEVVTYVVAKDEDHAMEVASDHLTGLEQFVGNGGMDKLIGVSEDYDSVEAAGEINWESADEVDPEDEGLTIECIYGNEN